MTPLAILGTRTDHNVSISIHQVFSRGPYIVFIQPDQNCRMQLLLGPCKKGPPMGNTLNQRYHVEKKHTRHSRATLNREEKLPSNSSSIARYIWHPSALPVRGRLLRGNIQSLSEPNITCEHRGTCFYRPSCVLITTDNICPPVTMVMRTGWSKHIGPNLLSIQCPRRFLEIDSETWHTCSTNSTLYRMGLLLSYFSSDFFFVCFFNLFLGLRRSNFSSEHNLGR